MMSLSQRHNPLLGPTRENESRIPRRDDMEARDARRT